MVAESKALEGQLWEVASPQLPPHTLIPFLSASTTDLPQRMPVSRPPASSVGLWASLVPDLGMMLYKGQRCKVLVLDFPVPRGLLLYEYWLAWGVFCLFGWFGFLLHYKRLKRLQSDDEEGVTCSALKGTHILGGGDRSSGTYHYPRSTYSVLSLVFL